MSIHESLETCARQHAAGNRQIQRQRDLIDRAVVAGQAKLARDSEAFLAQLVDSQARSEAHLAHLGRLSRRHSS